MTHRMNSAYCSTLVRLFIASAIVVLGVSAVAKMISASGESRMLAFPDPLLGVFSRRQVMVVAAMVEALIIVLVRREMDVARKAALVAWISTVFAVYRMGLWWIGYSGSCGCLGNLTDALGISAPAADWLMKLTLAYLLAGSYAIMAWMAVMRLRSLRPGFQASGT
jgi:hypothetical protein